MQHCLVLVNTVTTPLKNIVVCTAQNKVIFLCCTTKIAFTSVTKGLFSRLHDHFKAT